MLSVKIQSRIKSGNIVGGEIEHPPLPSPSFIAFSVFHQLLWGNEVRYVCEKRLAIIVTYVCEARNNWTCCSNDIFLINDSHCEHGAMKLLLLV